ncbi:MAG: 3,4-dihydroxy-2-butanone-4-phosphate synthase, partial [Verrucomicrobia bacterium]|nr:3,4-dihydroxy-2-butanone-4-phosphate synthase [Verrucomicrobiota bacterium]
MKKKPQGADKIEDVIAAMRRGRMVIMTDDAQRENEGDLILAARSVTPALINFMAREGRGLICAPVSQARAEKLGLTRMVPKNEEKFGTDFTVSVDALRGITTGISAHDRAATLRLLGRPNPKASDLVQPGHIFPVRAKDGGVLVRAGHTEASVDLAKLAGQGDAAVICEILKA